MAENQPKENIQQPAKKKTSRLKVVLIILALLFSLLVLKVILLITAKPKITVNYVAELNRISKPDNYDPNKNAAPYYQKAFDTFVEMPVELRKPYINWPTDYNSTDQVLLEDWLASNSQAFKHFKIAANKHYYWLQRQATKDNYVNSILIPELAKLRYLNEAIGWNAKLNASKGSFHLAFDDILDRYRAGRQKCRAPSLIMEQLIGLAFKRRTESDALTILDRTVIDNSTLRYFQDTLQVELNKDAFVPDIQVENLMLYDAVQRVFVDNGRGTGRLAFRTLKGLTCLCDERRYMFLDCFVGPTRNEVADQIEQLRAIFDAAKNQSPWQLHSQKSEHFKQIEAINNSNFFFTLLGINLHRIFQLHHQTRAQAEALITTLAILRFKNDNNQLPVTLKELVSSGYLQSIPIDPYSGRPLVYNLAQNNFKLYSFGSDFEDSGGTHRITTNVGISLRTGKISGEESGDIVYWPVKRLDKPRPRKPQPPMGLPSFIHKPKQKEN